MKKKKKNPEISTFFNELFENVSNIQIHLLDLVILYCIVALCVCNWFVVSLSLLHPPPPHFPIFVWFLFSLCLFACIALCHKLFIIGGNKGKKKKNRKKLGAILTGRKILSTIFDV